MAAARAVLRRLRHPVTSRPKPFRVRTLARPPALPAGRTTAPAARMPAAPLPVLVNRARVQPASRWVLRKVPPARHRPQLPTPASPPPWTNPSRPGPSVVMSWPRPWYRAPVPPAHWPRRQSRSRCNNGRMAGLPRNPPSPPCCTAKNWPRPPIRAMRWGRSRSTVGCGLMPPACRTASMPCVCASGCPAVIRWRRCRQGLHRTPRCCGWGDSCRPSARSWARAVPTASPRSRRPRRPAIPSSGAMPGSRGTGSSSAGRATKATRMPSVSSGGSGSQPVAGTTGSSTCACT